MEGYQFHIPHVGTRSKWQTFIAPFMVIPWLIVLLLWSYPDLAASLVTNHGGGLLHSTPDTIDSPAELQRTLHQKIQESQSEVSMESGYSTQQTIEEDMAYVAEYIQASLMVYMDETAAVVCYYGLMVFLCWSCIIWMILNIHYALIIFMPVIALLLCCGVYPQWLFEWNRAITNLVIGVLCYFLQLTPVFPDAEAHSTIITIPQPTRHMNRFLPIVKWILVIPHSLLLLILLPVFLVAAFVGYIVTSISGRYPDSLFRIVEAYLRLNFRVMSYSHLLVSDQYPSCSFFASADKPAAD